MPPLIAHRAARKHAMQPNPLCRLAVLLAAGLLLGAAPPEREVTIGTEGSYVPWNLTRADGRLDGFEPDLLRYICARARLRCRLVAQDWDGMIGALDARKIDMIADALQITAERRAVIDYSIPYALTTTVFVARRDSPLAAMPMRDRVMDLGDARQRAQTVAMLRRVMAGKTIGVPLAGIFDGFLRTVLGPAVRLKTYRTMGERDLDLLAGRMDLTIDDASYLRPLLLAPDMRELTVAGPELTGGELGAGEAFAVRKGDRALAERLNGAIRAASEDGTIRRLSLKWFHMDITPPRGFKPR